MYMPMHECFWWAVVCSSAEFAAQQSRLHEMIEQRKQARTQKDKMSEKRVSKAIQKEHRSIMRARKQAKIGRILEEFRGLKHITSIKKYGKRNYIGSVLGADGTVKTGRQDIADVFSDFYSELYRRKITKSMFDFSGDDSDTTQAVPIQPEEVKLQLKTMSNGKSADTRGVVVELLKHSGERMLELIANVFTDILQPGGQTPDQWRQTRLKVLFKKGDPRNVENYRPISILPILYKLFSKVLAHMYASVFLLFPCDHFCQCIWQG